jgi:3-methylcrotonyl-CoA carboxylase beta subunit
VMGGEQAGNVLSQVKIEQLQAQGKKLTEAEILAIQKPILEQYEREGSPYYSSARNWDDGILVPWKSRAHLALSLQTALNAPIGKTTFGTFRM